MEDATLRQRYVKARRINWGSFDERRNKVLDGPFREVKRL